MHLVNEIQEIGYCKNAAWTCSCLITVCLLWILIIWVVWVFLLAFVCSRMWLNTLFIINQIIDQYSITLTAVVEVKVIWLASWPIVFYWCHPYPPTIGQYLSLRPLLNSRIPINKSLTTNVLFCYSGERLLERTLGTRRKGVDSKISPGRLQHHLQTSVNG